MVLETMRLYLFVLALLAYAVVDAHPGGARWSKVVYPVVYNSSSNAQGLGMGFPDVLNISLGGFDLNLEKNSKLIPSIFTNKYFVEGKAVVKKHHVNCFYQGWVVGYPGWSVTMSTCHGLDGMFGELSSANDTYYVKPVNKAEDNIHQSHLLYTEFQEDMDVNGQCGTEGIFNNHSIHENIMKKQRTKRQNSLGEKIIELAVVVDHTQFTREGSNIDDVTERTFRTINYVDNTYRTNFNLRVVLVHLEIWSDGDLIEPHSYPATFLSRFLSYRSQITTQHDVAMLITGFDMDGYVYGIAYTNSMCNTNAVGVNQDCRPAIKFIGVTVAHELGHILNMDHDDDPARGCSCTDASGACVMAAVSGAPPVEWSDCNTVDLNEGFDVYDYDRCLLNQPTTTVMDAVCGNGIIEGDEQCDCGTIAQCSDACCDAATCGLASGAECASGPCCDTGSCSFNYGSVCRPAIDDCDITDYCLGDTHLCPEDHKVQDGSVCNGGDSYCFSGTCQSLLAQCQYHYGLYTAVVADDQCYIQLNSAGDQSGNCGHDPTSSSFLPCSNDNVMCGQLQCRGSFQYRDYGVSTSVTSHSKYIVSSGQYHNCKSFSIEPNDPEPNPGLIEDGTKCGDGEWCIGQQCTVISSYIEACPVGSNGLTCSGNGNCNHLNNCFCNVNFTGETCQLEYTHNEGQDIDECSTNNGGCEQVCTNTVGSFLCSCNSGYTLAADGSTCTDINECQLNTDNCQQSCVNTAGGFTCTCNSGYTLNGDGRTCNDVNECSTNNGGCAQTCTNNVGSFTCGCNNGYTLDGDGLACNDINECSTSNGGCEQVCTNTVGSFLCSCNSGYTLAADGLMCVDTNECQLNTDNCQQSCVNTAGGFTCTCNSGYTLNGDGRTCDDVNECDTNNGGCAQTCTNSVGSFLCSCNSGYTLAADGSTCTDINECQLNTDNCQQSCVNTAGGFTCACNSGYTLNGDGRTCDDVNECSTNNGGCAQTCTNNVGSFNCGCNTGYTLDGDGLACNDINECSTSNGGCEQVCTNTVGSFLCSCNSGYTLAADGLMCVDINECQLNTDNCQQSCVNTAGGFTCACNSGYTLNGDERTCNDVNECSTNNGGCEQVCTNTVGSFLCSCNSGYTLAADGSTCTDINECQLNTDNCQQSCVNTAGGFTCACNSGYTLNGDERTCDDVNECDTNNGGCAQTCTNTVGSFLCSCNSGYTLAADGLMCVDTNECQLNTDNCQQSCVNTAGGFTCTCNSGYTLNGDGRTCNDVNECLTNNRSCDHACLNTAGSFVCECITGYTLNEDGWTCDNASRPGEGTGGKRREQAIAAGVAGGLIGIALLGGTVIAIVLVMMMKKNHKKSQTVTPMSSNITHRVPQVNSNDLSNATSARVLQNVAVTSPQDSIIINTTAIPSSSVDVEHCILEIRPEEDFTVDPSETNECSDSHHSSTQTFHSVNSTVLQVEEIDNLQCMIDEKSVHHSDISINPSFVSSEQISEDRHVENKLESSEQSSYDVNNKDISSSVQLLEDDTLSNPPQEVSVSHLHSYQRQPNLPPLSATHKLQSPSKFSNKQVLGDIPESSTQSPDQPTVESLTTSAPCTAPDNTLQIETPVLLAPSNPTSRLRRPSKVPRPTILPADHDSSHTSELPSSSASPTSRLRRPSRVSRPTNLSAESSQFETLNSPAHLGPTSKLHQLSTSITDAADDSKATEVEGSSQNPNNQQPTAESGTSSTAPGPPSRLRRPSRLPRPTSLPYGTSNVLPLFKINDSSPISPQLKPSHFPSKPASDEGRNSTRVHSPSRQPPQHMYSTAAIRTGAAYYEGIKSLIKARENSALNQDQPKVTEQSHRPVSQLCRQSPPVQDKGTSPLFTTKQVSSSQPPIQSTHTPNLHSSSSPASPSITAKPVAFSNQDELETPKLTPQKTSPSPIKSGAAYYKGVQSCLRARQTKQAKNEQAASSGVQSVSTDHGRKLESSPTDNKTEQTTSSPAKRALSSGRPRTVLPRRAAIAVPIRPKPKDDSSKEPNSTKSINPQ